MRYLQEEYAGLVVGGVYGSRTKKLFRSLGSNASAWSNNNILARVKTAVDLAAIRPEDQVGSSHSRGSHGGRPFGRGFGHSSFGRGARGS